VQKHSAARPAFGRDEVSSHQRRDGHTEPYIEPLSSHVNTKSVSVVAGGQGTIVQGELTRGSIAARWKRYGRELEKQRFQVRTSEPWARRPGHSADLCSSGGNMIRSSTKVNILLRGFLHVFAHKLTKSLTVRSKASSGRIESQGQFL